jgi:hypothetical protein
MVEYLIVLPVLLMLVLGAVQFALLYQVKSTLNYAAFMGARQGSIKNATTSSVRQGLASGISPLFTFSPDAKALLRGRSIGLVEGFNPLTMKVEILSPTPEAIDDFGGEDYDDKVWRQKTMINNDNLTYRPTTLGATSQVSIQDANILKIRVTYCAKMVVPLANATIWALLNGVDGAKNFAADFFSKEDSAPKTPNMCTLFVTNPPTDIINLPELGTRMGVDMSAVDEMIAIAEVASNSALDSYLNWELAGYRIPITAEAVIRMQSNPKVKK